ncbi:glycoside hydrolase family 3 C-terminal domain-containing protein [Knoellia sp. 3-2P3]|uniref:beta-glucosidase family protein n=1 Tax=unclassified Knoellia TaxID=2618719 RepID=UPI0023D9C819|nr:glycoside hydrolase family 3 C-terminal domain-containing protein [Knoellia sp. 3-2P3]MDF2091364.1 glycoside hydrolase family 3 C-terminal domain-containing protein [Knoellia sp. 3-2P3]
MTTDNPYAALLAKLDLRTKVRLLTGETAFTLWGEEGIGLAPMAFSDGPTGVRGLKFTGGEKVALFPNATVLASAWNEQAAREVGEMLAEEAERQRIHVVLGPTINLHRSPLGGRLFEQYSEDPLLTGRLAAAYVKGLQDKGIGACLKHLVANESETLRNYMNSVVSEEALREVYLLPFEIAVEESNPWSIMAAYNDVNGVAATEQDHVNNEVVKDEWGWDGLLMSDWFATKTSAPAALGGLDLVMPGPDGPWGEALARDVESGAVPESVVDEHVTRLLRLAERVGALGGPERHRRWPTQSTAPDAPERRAQLRRLATDGMVVLQNSGVLPLDPAGTGTLALVGRHGVETVCMGGGSAQVNPPYQVSIAEGLRAAIGDRLTVVDGVEVRERPVVADPRWLRDPETGETGVRVRHYDADGALLGDAHSDIASVSVGWDDSFPRPVETVTIAARVSQGGRAQLGALGVGAWTLKVDGADLAGTTLVAEGYDPGESMLKPPAWTHEADLAEGALVEATVTLVRSEPQPAPTGEVNQLSHIIASGMGLKSLVARPVPAAAEETIAAAVEAARAADVAVVVVGLTEEQETEALDKHTLALPGEQDALVAAVAEVASRTVVVVNAATPVLMPWAAAVDAVVVVGLPGQEGGHAVADALLGVREPAGRLVTSYPAADGDAPAWDVVPTDLRLEYTDGTFVGYRGFAAGHAKAPAWWFGHGLGYGSWDYLSAQLSRTTAAGAPRLEVTVHNNSERDSREVVQVYLQPAETDQPVRLVGWSAAEVAAGGTSTVTVDCDARLWRRWDSEADRWSVLADGGELLVARGLGDVRQRLAL